MYGRRMSRQERLIVHLADPIRAPAHPFLPLQPFLARQEGGFQHQHDAVHEPVHDLEPAAPGQKRGGEVALVAALALERRVLEGDVADLEDADRDAVVLVLPERLEEAREEGRAHDLVLRRLGVGQSDGGGAVVGAVQVGEVLRVRAED